MVECTHFLNLKVINFMKNFISSSIYQSDYAKQVSNKIIEQSELDAHTGPIHKLPIRNGRMMYYKIKNNFIFFS